MNNAVEVANNAADAINNATNASAGNTQIAGISNWACFLGLVGVVFAIACFAMFLWDTWSRVKAQADAVRAAAAAGAAAGAAAVATASRGADDGSEGALGFDLAVLSGAVKALVEALKNATPGLVALIGAILFLVLAGQATQVWKIVGEFPEGVANSNSGGGTGNSSSNATVGNESEEAGNATENNTSEGNNSSE